ncbi:uncharacterized protein LOC114022142 isoform X4 [Chelonia mydas]|uniref:uncharacterized protein LOC114022142 isoform X4 n=1 Tax=Chelonia mydas TaxID=8469 RepID=UPI001CA817EE|nr:uncharacterized protein LOC114022142 isoform X4 [Chelonia mydas]
MNYTTWLILPYASREQNTATAQSCAKMTSALPVSKGGTPTVHSAAFRRLIRTRSFSRLTTGSNTWTRGLTLQDWLLLGFLPQGCSAHTNSSLLLDPLPPLFCPGLKILRCCNHCEIVGTIKGEKKFKGAHWHCYRCRNGFNRRDEAVKHYKTHFRNPHTTFQIQITQDVNSRQYYQHSAEAHPKAYGSLHVSTGASIDVMAIGSVLAQTVLASGSPVFTTDKGTESLSGNPAKDSSFNSRIMLGVEEMAGLSTSASSLPTHQTLVLMDPDGDSGNIIFEEGDNSVAGQIASIVQANICMAEELKRYQTSDDLEKKVSKMVEQMEWQHRELLQMQVAALRKEFAQKESQLTNGKSTPPADAALETREPAVTSSMHTLLANAALASTNSTGSARFTLPNSLVGPQNTATPRPLDISTGDVISFIDPPESLSGTGSNSLEKLEIVELHLDTKPTIANQEAGSPPAHIQLLPIGEMNESMGLLPSLGGEKRLAQRALARETKAKQQRTV